VGVAVALFLGVLASVPAPADHRAEMAALEHAVAADPENLRLAADYRQLAIASADFNRSIDFLEALAKRKDSGPNVQVSLALAYIDKVPAAGEIRRLYIGRDAMSALSKSIARRPSVLAYYLRGLINLYYNRLIFKRTAYGIADLQQALTMVTGETPPALVARLYRSLGDGYWRLDERQHAREAWSHGAERYPEDAALKARLVADEGDVGLVVRRAMDPDRRADTGLRDLLP
jgi:hypothetical protein